MNTTQTLRLLGKQNVFVGRQITQTANQAVNPLTGLTEGLDISASVLTTNRIAAYSQSGDVWVKESTIGAGQNVQLNLVGKHDAVLATVAALLSAPTTYCEPGLLS